MMQYLKLKVKEKTFYYPNPSNWAELRQSIHDNDRFLTSDPNNIEPDEELLKLFFK